MIRPAGEYKFVYADEMLVYSGSTDTFDDAVYESGRIDGLTEVFKKPPNDEMIRDTIFQFLAAYQTVVIDRLGSRRVDRVTVRWPHGRLENWFAAERMALDCKIEGLKLDPDAKGLLEPGMYTLVSEEDFEYLTDTIEFDPKTFWKEDVDEYVRANWLEADTFVVGKNDRMSSSRIKGWHEQFICRYLKGLRLDADRQDERVLLLHRPNGFIERRSVFYTPIIQMGAAPCKIEDKIFPRWPQGDPLPEAELVQ
jgi:hypothetical protein